MTSVVEIAPNGTKMHHTHTHFCRKLLRWAFCGCELVHQLFTGRYAAKKGGIQCCDTFEAKRSWNPKSETWAPKCWAREELEENNNFHFLFLLAGSVFRFFSCWQKDAKSRSDKTRHQKVNGKHQAGSRTYNECVLTLCSCIGLYSTLSLYPNVCISISSPARSVRMPPTTFQSQPLWPVYSRNFSLQFFPPYNDIQCIYLYISCSMCFFRLQCCIPIILQLDGL